MAEAGSVEFDVYLIPTGVAEKLPSGCVRMGSIEVVPNHPNLGQHVHDEVRAALQENVDGPVEEKLTGQAFREVQP